MPLTLILGPVKSAKSLELIAQAMPYEIAGKSVAMVQPKRNVRDKAVTSRAGLEKEAVHVSILSDLADTYDVIVIDEVHMFESKADIEQVRDWILQDKTVIAAGISTDYASKVPPMIARLHGLCPEKVVYKYSVCELCSSLEGTHTQILHNNQVVRSGLPPVVPEDGTYQYRTVCRQCFFAEDS